jgi:hypothetical protein
MLEPRAATAECLGHFNKHLVCGDAGVVFEPVGARGSSGAYAHPRKNWAAPGLSNAKQGEAWAWAQPSPAGHFWPNRFGHFCSGYSLDF